MGWITLISPHWYCVIVIYSNERVRESKWAVAHRFWFWRVSLIQTNTHTLLRSGFVCVPRLFLWHWRSCVNVCARVWMSMDSIRIEKFLLRIKCVLLFFTSLLLCRCVFFLYWTWFACGKIIHPLNCVCLRFSVEARATAAAQHAMFTKLYYPTRILQIHFMLVHFLSLRSVFFGSYVLGRIVCLFSL